MSEKIDIDIQQIGTVSPATALNMSESGGQTDIVELEPKLKQKGLAGRVRRWFEKRSHRRRSKNEEDEIDSEVTVDETAVSEIVAMDAATSTFPKTVTPLRDLKVGIIHLKDQLALIKEKKRKTEFERQLLVQQKLEHEIVIMQDRERRRLSQKLSREMDQVLIEKINLERQNGVLSEKPLPKAKPSAEPKMTRGTQTDVTDLRARLQNEIDEVEAKILVNKAELERLDHDTVFLSMRQLIKTH